MVGLTKRPLFAPFTIVEFPAPARLQGLLRPPTDYCSSCSHVNTGANRIPLVRLFEFCRERPPWRSAARERTCYFRIPERRGGRSLQDFDRRTNNSNSRTNRLQGSETRESSRCAADGILTNSATRGVILSRPLLSVPLREMQGSPRGMLEWARA